MISKKNDGWAAVAVVAVVLLLFTLAIVSVSLGKSQKKASSDYFNRMQAYYKADSGVEKTIAYIKEHPRWVKSLGVGGGGVPAEINLTDGEGPVKVIRENTSGYDSVIITSTGRHRNGIQMLEVEVLLEEPLDFSKGLWAGSLPTGENGAVYSGICHVGKIPESNLDFYIWRASREYLAENGKLHELVLTPDSDIRGITYCEGDLVLHGSYEGQGTVVSTGDIHIGGTLEPVDDDSVLTVVSFGDIIIESCRVECLVYAAGDLILESGSEVVGSLIAENIHLDAGSSFLFASRWRYVQTETVASCLKPTKWGEVYK